MAEARPPRCGEPKSADALLLGEKGGYGQWGRHRSVFYSDTAAPIIERLFKAADGRAAPILEANAADKRIAATMQSQPIARRFDRLLDLLDR
jgi:hypothetical protein